VIPAQCQTYKIFGFMIKNQTLVNSGCNYDSPKVAKYLVG